VGPEIINTFRQRAIAHRENRGGPRTLGGAVGGPTVRKSAVFRQDSVNPGRLALSTFERC
jgi:hypothetical protein